jgi:hypothetical protein
MLPDGHYSAWFRIPRYKEGMGVVTLADGIISGRDTVISYRGSYVQTGDTFTATIATRRHSAGQDAIFGIDEVDIELVGTSKTTTAACTGKVLQRPGVAFEVVLVRMEG